MPTADKRRSKHSQRFRVLLEARRAQLQRDVDARLTRVRERASDPTLVREGEADDACDLDVQVLEMATSTLRRIDAAIERLERGDYGRCNQCGHAISATRLDAMPFAVRCRGCEHERERAAAGRRRVVRQRLWEVHEALAG
jgi:DnaK suppressor protein